MARNAIESDFRSSKMAQKGLPKWRPAAILKKNSKKKSCVLIWNGEKCNRKWFLVIQNGRRRPFCKKKIPTFSNFLPLFPSFPQLSPLILTFRHFFQLFATFSNFSPLFPTFPTFSHFFQLFTTISYFFQLSVHRIVCLDLVLQVSNFDGFLLNLCSTWSGNNITIYHVGPYQWNYITFLNIKIQCVNGIVIVSLLWHYHMLRHINRFWIFPAWQFIVLDGGGGCLDIWYLIFWGCLDIWYLIFLGCLDIWYLIFWGCLDIWYLIFLGCLDIWYLIFLGCLDIWYLIFFGVPRYLIFDFFGGA